MKKESTFKKSIKQSLLISGFLGFIVINVLMLYNSMDTPIERFAVSILGICMIAPLMPIILMLIFNFILGSMKQAKMESKSNDNTFNTNAPKSSPKPNTVEDKPKLRIVTTDGYMEFNNILKASVKNKLITRQVILQLKSELIYRLGTHIEVYKGFEFKNDLHEIYTLSKSSVLTKDDYLYLTDFISNNLILPKEA